MNDSLEQLPASTFTPIEVEVVDRRQLAAQLDSISERLEGVKRDFAILYPEETRRQSAAATSAEGIGRIRTHGTNAVPGTP